MPLFQDFKGFDPASLAISAGSGLLSLFGGGNQMTPEQQRQYQLQSGIAQQLAESGRGVPGSSPQERAALAQAQGQLGAQQLSQQNNAYAALSRNSSPGQLADFMGNQISLQTAQRQALDSQAMLASMAQRRNDLLQAAQVSQGAAGTASGPRTQNALPGLFAGLSQQAGYQQGYGGQPGQPQQPGQPGAGHTTLADVGVTPNEFNTPNPAAYQSLLAGMGSAGNSGGPGGAWLPTTPGQYNQAAQGSQGLLQPANIPGGANSMANQWRQTQLQGSIPGMGSPFGGGWFPPYATLPNGVNLQR